MVEQQTKIAHLLQMPVGQGTGGYTLYVKTFKKRYEVAGRWRQQCICADDTGELLVEVNLHSNIRLSREFKVVVGKMMEMDWMNKTRKALLVFEYTEPTQTADEWMEQADIAFQGEIKTIRSKIKCLLACHNGPKNDPTALLLYLKHEHLLQCVDEIMEG